MPAARSALIAPSLAVALLLAGCADDTPGTAGPAEAATPTATAPATPTSTPTSTSTTTPAPPPTAPATGTVVTVGDSEFGPMLFDGTGQAVYLFDRETTSTPSCYDECAEAWPPVRTDGAPRATGSTDPALLGTTRRADGTTQVTYAGHPLYTYANEDPGQVLCHDVFLNGGTWYVVTPAGTPGPV